MITLKITFGGNSFEADGDFPITDILPVVTLFLTGPSQDPALQALTARLDTKNAAVEAALQEAPDGESHS